MLPDYDSVRLRACVASRRIDIIEDASCPRPTYIHIPITSWHLCRRVRGAHWLDNTPCVFDSVLGGDATRDSTEQNQHSFPFCQNPKQPSQKDSRCLEDTEEWTPA